MSYPGSTSTPELSQLNQDFHPHPGESSTAESELTLHAPTVTSHVRRGGEGRGEGGGERESTNKHTIEYEIDVVVPSDRIDVFQPTANPSGDVVDLDSIVSDEERLHEDQTNTVVKTQSDDSTTATATATTTTTSPGTAATVALPDMAKKRMRAFYCCGLTYD